MPEQDQNRTLMLVAGLALVGGAGWLAYDAYRKSRVATLTGPPFTYNGRTYQLQLVGTPVYYHNPAGAPAPAASADWAGAGNNLPPLPAGSILVGPRLRVNAGQFLRAEMTVRLLGEGAAPVGVAGWIVSGLRPGQRPASVEGHFFSTTIGQAADLAARAVTRNLSLSGEYTFGGKNSGLTTYALSGQVPSGPLGVVWEVAPLLSGDPAREDLAAFVREPGALWFGQADVYEIQR